MYVLNDRELTENLLPIDPRINCFFEIDFIGMNIPSWDDPGEEKGRPSNFQHWRTEQVHRTGTTVQQLYIT